MSLSLSIILVRFCVERIKHWPKATYGWEGFPAFYNSQVIIHPLREVRAGAEDRNLEAGTRAEVTEGAVHLLVPHGLLSLDPYTPGPSTQGWHHYINHQLIKCSTGFLQANLERRFLSWTLTQSI